MAFHKQTVHKSLLTIPATLFQRGALNFWFAVVCTGLGAGFAAAVFTKILEWVQHATWSGSGQDILEAASAAAPSLHVFALVGAGALTAMGQLVLTKLTSGNSIDVTEAIWFRAGRLPLVRTLGSALLSIVTVGLGASLGREGAPKQAGAVFANFFSNRGKLSDDERRLLVACGAGAGMAAAYGVPLGGALFALEVLRGVLALRLVLPALVASVLATMVSWIALPDRPTYLIPSFTVSASVLCWAVVAGPLIGILSVGYVRLIRLADHHKPQNFLRFVVPVFSLGLIGVVSIWFPQILGNGKDLAQILFSNSVALPLLICLFFLKPLATALCVGGGTPGGLFTPSLSFGALTGAGLGLLWSHIWPGVEPGLFALVGATAMLAATTQGPISALVLMMELTGQDRSFIIPVLLAVITATLVARTIEPRSIYDARLTDEEVRERLRSRLPATQLR
jgi:CIC family chloride channel protein